MNCYDKLPNRKRRQPAGSPCSPSRSLDHFLHLLCSSAPVERGTREPRASRLSLLVPASLLATVACHPCFSPACASRYCTLQYFVCSVFPYRYRQLLLPLPCSIHEPFLVLLHPSPVLSSTVVYCTGPFPNTSSPDPRSHGPR